MSVALIGYPDPAANKITAPSTSSRLPGQAAERFRRTRIEPIAAPHQAAPFRAACAPPGPGTCAARANDNRAEVKNLGADISLRGGSEISG